MQQAFNKQWLNQNGNRSYPLTTWATKRDITDSIQLPDSFLVGLYVPINSGLAVEPGKFFLHTLGIYTSGFNIAIGYDDGTASPPIVAATNIARSTHTENLSYALVGVGDFDDSVGRIVIGRLDEIDQLPPGQYRFDLAGGGLETDCIRPIIRGISSLTVVNGSDRSPRIYGDVELVAGANMRLVANIVEGQDPEVVISAIAGEGLNEECECDEADEGPPIRTINGIPPLPDGNFRMIGDDCTDIAAITNGLQFADKCSEPCCGCAELDAVVRQIDRFADNAVTLQNYLNTLGSNVDQMSLVVLGSRLFDQGCVECS